MRAFRCLHTIPEHAAVSRYRLPSQLSHGHHHSSRTSSRVYLGYRLEHYRISRAKLGSEEARDQQGHPMKCGRRFLSAAPQNISAEERARLLARAVDRLLLPPATREQQNDRWNWGWHGVDRMSWGRAIMCRLRGFALSLVQSVSFTRICSEWCILSTQDKSGRISSGSSLGD